MDSTFEEEPTVVVEDILAEKSSTFSDWLAGPECPPELEDAYAHNRPLTEAERTKLIQIEAQVDLSGRKRTISELDAQIEDLQRRRERLVKETIALSGSLGRLRERLGAPIRRVPFEVLQEIAAYSHPSHPAPTLAQFKSAFAGVCSTWRDAALSSPQLWATLYIRVGSRASLKAAGVSEWLRRANGLPITLYLDFVRNSGTPMARLTDITHFFRSISPSLVCLSHLGIRARNLDTLKSLFEEPLNWDISELHQLDIRTHFLGGLKLSSPLDPLKLFKSPPPLTRLTLAPLIDSSQSKAAEWAERWPPSWVSPRIFNFDAQWSQLTYIRLSAPIDLGDWISIMELANNLQTASFELTARDPIFERPRSSSIHTHFENLTLTLDGTCSHIALSEIMQIFQLPKLKILEVFRVDQDYADEAMDRPPDIDYHDNTWQEFEHLESFSLRCFYDENIRPLLLQTRNLHTLSIRMQGEFTHKLITELSHHGEEHVLPRLSSLRVICCEYLGFPEKAAFLNLLRATHPIDGTLPCGCHPLQNVVLDIEAEEAIPDLDKYAAATRSRTLGPDIEISYGGAVLHSIMPFMKSFDDIY